MSVSYKGMLVCAFCSLLLFPTVGSTGNSRTRGQLEFAQALGYGTKKDFDKMYDELREVVDKTAGNKSGTGWFSKIKASIADFLKSSQAQK